MGILVLGEGSHLSGALRRVVIHHHGDQQGIGDSVGNMVVCAKLVGHGVAHAQEGVGKCHTSHAGGIGHLLTGLHISRLIVSNGQIVKYILHSL